MVKFSDNFWSEVCHSTVGFDALTKRLKEGKQVSKELEDFIKQRAKAEEDYAKALLRLSTSALGKCEIGTMKGALDKVKKETEAIAAVHQNLAQSLSEQAARIHGMFERQNAMRKSAEEVYKKSFSAKVDSFRKMTTAKKTYQAKYSAVVYAQSQLTGADAEKESYREKMEMKKAKADEEEQRADGAYKASVEVFNRARLDWEKQMTRTCDVYQELEEQRLQVLRNELWAHTNLSSKVTVDVDCAYERMRDMLANCSWEDDVALFVKTRKTGSIKPPAAVYESMNGGRSPGGASTEDHHHHLGMPSRADSSRSSNMSHGSATYGRPLSRQ